MLKKSSKISCYFSTSTQRVQGAFANTLCLSRPFTAFLSPFLESSVICLLPPVQVDVFTIKAIDLGELKKLRIGHDNTGASPSWFLERVEIIDLKESTT